jgi:hypothetical protein
MFIILHFIAFHIFFTLHPIHICVSNVIWMWGQQAFWFDYVQSPIIIERHWRCEGLITSLIGDYPYERLIFSQNSNQGMAFVRANPLNNNLMGKMLLREFYTCKDLNTLFQKFMQFTLNTKSREWNGFPFFLFHTRTILLSVISQHLCLHIFQQHSTTEGGDWSNAKSFWHLTRFED